MYYLIDKEALFKLVEEEVSKAADEAYADSGVSLYDAVVLTDKDNDMVDRFIDDAVNLAVRRAYDICKFSPETEEVDGEIQPTGRMRLYFYVPDFDDTMEDAVKRELDRYVAMYVSGNIFQQRRAALVPEYTTRTQAALDNAVTMLKSRKYPSVLW